MIKLESQSQYDFNMLSNIESSLDKRRRESPAFTSDSGYGHGAYLTKALAAFNKSGKEAGTRLREGIDTTAEVLSDKFIEYKSEETKKAINIKRAELTKQLESGKISFDEYYKSNNSLRYKLEETQSLEAQTSGTGYGTMAIGGEKVYGGVQDMIYGSLLSVFSPNSSLGLSKIDSDPFHRTAFEKTAMSVFNGLANANQAVLTEVEQQTAKDPILGAKFIEDNKMEGVDVMMDLAGFGGFKLLKGGSKFGKAPLTKLVGKGKEGLTKAGDVAGGGFQKAKGIFKKAEVVEDTVTKVDEVAPVASKAEVAEGIVTKTDESVQAIGEVKVIDDSVATQDWIKSTKDRKLTSIQTLEELSDNLPTQQFYSNVEATLSKMPEGTSKEMFKNSVQEVMYNSPNKFAPQLGVAVNSSKEFVVKKADEIVSPLVEGPVRGNAEVLNQVRAVMRMEEPAFNDMINVLTPNGVFTKEGITLLKNRTKSVIKTNIAKLAGNTDSIIQKAIKADPLGFVSNRKIFDGLNTDSINQSVFDFIQGKKSQLSNLMGRLSKTREVYNPTVQKMAELSATVPEVYDVMKKGFDEKMSTGEIMQGVRDTVTKHINNNPQAKEFIARAEESLGMKKSEVPSVNKVIGDVWEGTKKAMDTSKKHLAKLKTYGISEADAPKTHLWLNNKAAGKQFSDELPVIVGALDETNESIINNFVVEARRSGSVVSDETINNTVSAVDMIKNEVKDFIENPSSKGLIIDSEEAVNRPIAAMVGEKIIKILKDSGMDFDRSVILDAINKSMDITDTSFSGGTFKDVFGIIAKEKNIRTVEAAKKGIDKFGIVDTAKKDIDKFRIEDITPEVKYNYDMDKAIKKARGPKEFSTAGLRDELQTTLDETYGEAGNISRNIDSYIKEQGTGYRNVASTVEDYERGMSTINRKGGDAMSSKESVGGMELETFQTEGKKTLKNKIGILDKISKLEDEIKILDKAENSQSVSLKRNRRNAEKNILWNEYRKEELESHVARYKSSNRLEFLDKKLDEVNTINDLDIKASSSVSSSGVFTTLNKRAKAKKDTMISVLEDAPSGYKTNHKLTPDKLDGFKRKTTNPAEMTAQAKAVYEEFNKYKTFLKESYDKEKTALRVDSLKESKTVAFQSQLEEAFAKLNTDLVMVHGEVLDITKKAVESAQGGVLGKYQAILGDVLEKTKDYFENLKFVNDKGGFASKELIEKLTNEEYKTGKVNEKGVKTFSNAYTVAQKAVSSDIMIDKVVDAIFQGVDGKVSKKAIKDTFTNRLNGGLGSVSVVPETVDVVVKQDKELFIAPFNDKTAKASISSEDAYRDKKIKDFRSFSEDAPTKKVLEGVKTAIGTKYEGPVIKELFRYVNMPKGDKVKKEVYKNFLNDYININKPKKGVYNRIEEMQSKLGDLIKATKK